MTILLDQLISRTSDASFNLFIIISLHQISSFYHYKFSLKEFIAKKELIYRRGPMEEILLPYYRFYVLLPEETPPYAAEKGLKTYGAYYVPAIVD